MFTFNIRYFIAAIILFVIEVLIALYVRDSIIRPYGGDYLVVIFVYCVVRSFLDASAVKVAIGVLLFSYLVETLQYFQLVNRLGLQHNKVMRTVIGYGFDWIDLLAYTLGIIPVILIEQRRASSRRR